MLAQIQAEYPNDVRIVFRHFPLPQHDKSALAAQATEAAGLQGKFWEMHDLLFSRQADWVTLTAPQFEDWLKTQAAALGLDASKFEADLYSPAIVEKVKQAGVEADKLGLPGTPYLLVNGKPSDVPKDENSIKAIVKLYKLTERQFTTCPPMTIDPHKQYTATLKTGKGDVVLQLYADKAPMTVNNFVFLAHEHWYDGVTFHFVIPGTLAQAGDPSGTGYGTPGYFFTNEIDPQLKFDVPGVVGMYNTGPNSNGSQFFITESALSDLDGKYTIFGKVIQGMDVVQKLTVDDQILSVTIEDQ